jgi:NAD(P)-dependent dehydrogenase (short-subunit alcohol dehydrogenase family)
MSSYLDQLFSLEGRVAVVTGGSSGIGRGIATALASAGAAVVIVARGQAGLDATVAAIQDLGGKAVAISADLGDRAAVAKAVAAARQPFGPPGILVNCAGLNLRPPLGELTIAQWDQLMAVNLTAAFLLGQAFGPEMAERGWGRIINIGSQQSVSAFGDSGLYGASKAGIAGLTRSQAEAWSRHGVCVNTIIPGFVLTPLTAQAASDPERVKYLAGRAMAKRNGLPEDFRGAALFLASAASAYVTGQMLFVDGGFSVH